MYTVILKCDICGKEEPSDVEMILSQRPPSPWRIFVTRLRTSGSVMGGDSPSTMHVCTESCMMHAIAEQVKKFESEGYHVADVVMYAERKYSP